MLATGAASFKLEITMAAWTCERSLVSIFRTLTGKFSTINARITPGNTP